MQPASMAILHIDCRTMDCGSMWAAQHAIAHPMSTGCDNIRGGAHLQDSDGYGLAGNEGCYQARQVDHAPGVPFLQLQQCRSLSCLQYTNADTSHQEKTKAEFCS